MAILFENGVTRIDVEGRVLTLTLCHPPANLLNMEVFLGIDEALELLETRDLDLLLITGEKQVFSKGFDLDLMASCSDRREMRSNLLKTNAVFSRLAKTPKPTVAAINGYCLGGGFELVLCCDFRVCKEKTRLGLPEVWTGMLPGLGGIHRLARMVGQAKALELVALGDLITSDQARELGLVNRVYGKQSFADDALTFVQTLLLLDQRVLRRILLLTRQAIPLPDEDNILEELQAFGELAPWMQDATGGGDRI